MGLGGGEEKRRKLEDDQRIRKQSSENARIN